MNKIIYITEDDESIRELVKMSLESFSYEVFAFEKAEDTLAKCESMLPGLFIFDLMLPGMDGISAVKLLRSKYATKDLPVLMLTAKDTEVDKVLGLDAGADDYLVKPFGIMELAARVRALLRRNAKDGLLIRQADITLNIAAREVYKGEVLIDLSFKEFELLHMLMKNRNRVIPREELLSVIWGYDFTGETRTLDAHIKSLRQKLDDNAEKPKYIKTFRSVGYRFCEEMP